MQQIPRTIIKENNIVKMFLIILGLVFYTVTIAVLVETFPLLSVTLE
jgi:hypothetical protein